MSALAANHAEVAEARRGAVYVPRSARLVRYEVPDDGSRDAFARAFQYFHDAARVQERRGTREAIADRSEP